MKLHLSRNGFIFILAIAIAIAISSATPVVDPVGD
jgi:hypothetical protein